MCLSKAYVERRGKKELLMEEIVSVEIKDGRLLLKTLFGEQKEVGANIREINFLTSSMVLVNFEG